MAARIVEVANSVHFSTRSNAALLAAAGEHGLTEPMRLVVDGVAKDKHLSRRVARVAKGARALEIDRRARFEVVK